MINNTINKLVNYGIEKNLIKEEDRIYITNQLLAVLNLSEYDEPEAECGELDIEEILKEIDDYAVKTGIIAEDTVTNRDLFDTKIMGILTPRPSCVIKKFRKLYKNSPKDATDYFYKLSRDSDYIRTYRVKKDLKWITKTPYGDLDITINLSKPEKDSKAIANAKNLPQSGYPKCALCIQNEGYAGRINHPARQNIRLIPVKLNEEEWSFQYSPYVYYNEHCIVLNNKHVPMKIDKSTLAKLLDFVEIFPHYFLGSNAGLPIVGGSILTHEHYQGGNFEFAMTRAQVEKEYKIKGYEDILVGILKWPMSVIRIKSKDKNRLIELGAHILNKWEDYTDEESIIYAETNGEKHNAITPIARQKDGIYELDLVLRNNLTTDEYPDGVFHPHKEYHNIKKENIGLIEVMGLAVLPPRLKEEMKLVEEYMLENKNVVENEKIAKHEKWVEAIKQKYNNINKENIDSILKEEIGQTFLNVLHDAGVFKRNEAGKAAFDKFMQIL